MIIEIEPGARVTVPSDSDYQIRMETSFSALELSDAGTEIGLSYMGPTGVAGEITGSRSGTDVLFLVTPSQFSPGEWNINPRLKVSGFTRRWPISATLVVKGPTMPGVDCGC